MAALMRVSGNYAAAIGLLGLLVLSAAILYDALSRSIFNAPVYGLSDLVEIVTPVIVASCFPLALVNKQNITIRFLGRALSPRAGQLVEVFGQLCALLILCGILWQLAAYTASLTRHGQFTWLLRLPIWPSWIVATLLMALCVPIQIANTWISIRDAMLGRALQSSEIEIEDEIDRNI